MKIEPKLEPVLRDEDHQIDALRYAMSWRDDFSAKPKWWKRFGRSVSVPIRILIAAAIVIFAFGVAMGTYLP